MSKISKATVYFSKDEFNKILEVMPQIPGRVGIKIHVGEQGNVTYMKPEYSNQVLRYLEDRGALVKLIECNVLYRGSRTNRKDHLETAKSHGFNHEKLDILDGEYGADSWEIKTGLKHFDKITVGKGLKMYDSVITLSHFKGHGANGFGGALKNLGMGLGSRSGKMAMHAAFDLKIDDELCLGCGICVSKCDFEAIQLNEQGKASIDFDKCMRCAGCIANCPRGAVQTPWDGASSEGLQERIVEFCYGISRNVNCPFYINVLENITARCDCAGVEMEPISPDLGFLASSDPVALDQASIDLVVKANGGNVIKLINKVDATRQLSYAEELGLGTRAYEMVEL